MRLSMIMMSLLISITTFANSIEEAQELFAQRGDDTAYATQAAQMYGELAAAETDAVAKATLLNGQSEAIYYVGTHTGSKSEKRKLHESAYKIAQEAISGLETISAPTVEEKNLLATSIYWYSANFGQWGKTLNVFQRALNWPTLKKALFRIIDDVQADYVVDYGVYRVLSKAYLTLPTESDAEALEFMTKAYKNTVNETGTSINSTNTIYYAEALIENGEDEKATEVLNTFINFVEDNGAEELNAARVPETEEDLELAYELLDDLE